MSRPPHPAEEPALVLSTSALVIAAVAAVFFAVGVIVGVLLTRSSAPDAQTIELIVRRALADVTLERPTADRFALVGDAPSLGPADAPVVIVEFSAYGCPYCKRFHDETLPSILENYGDVVRYVYRDMPTVNPQVSFTAAMAARCARDQGKFWEYHSAIFAHQADLSEERLRGLAAELALDVAAFDECLSSRRHYDAVNADFLEGALAGVSTTPNFFINGTLYTGAQPFSFFQEVIERELFKAGVRRAN